MLDGRAAIKHRITRSKKAGRRACSSSPTVAKSSSKPCKPSAKPCTTAPSASCSSVGEEPTRWNHVFATIQSAASRDLLANPRRLRERDVNVLCTCDLYNEGIDTYPTSTLCSCCAPPKAPLCSCNSFGRGLRHDKHKTACVVLDFIGQHRAEFRFDSTLSALTGIPRASLARAIEQGLPLLPSGCAMQLDTVARDQILSSLRQSLARKSRIVQELRELVPNASQPFTLAQYLEATGREIEDVYAAGGWTALRRAAGLLPEPENLAEDARSERLSRLLHVDEPSRLRAWLAHLRDPNLHVSDIDARRLTMLSFQLEPRGIVRTAAETLAPLRAPVLADELAQLATVLEDRVALPTDSFPVPDWPLASTATTRAKKSPPPSTTSAPAPKAASPKPASSKSAANASSSSSPSTNPPNPSPPPPATATTPSHPPSSTGKPKPSPACIAKAAAATWSRRATAGASSCL
jgi:hypothetical protein